MEISEELLQGKTLRIYWYIIEHPESGIREIDRQLALNSPSTVLYHIKKLLDAELVEKTSDDKYLVTEAINTGIFSLYLKIGSRMIPRVIFYLSFLLTAFVLFLIIILTRDPLIIYLEDIFSLFIIICSVIFFLLETICVWKMKPS